MVVILEFTRFSCASTLEDESEVFAELPNTVVTRTSTLEEELLRLVDEPC